MLLQWSLNILLTFRYISFVYRCLLNLPFCCFTLAHESDRPLSKTWRLSQEIPLPVIVIRTWKTEVHESSCLLFVKIRTCCGSWTRCCTCFTLQAFLLNNFPSFSSDRFHQTTSRGAINVINYPSLVTWWLILIYLLSLKQQCQTHSSLKPTFFYLWQFYFVYVCFFF